MPVFLRNLVIFGVKNAWIRKIPSCYYYSKISKYTYSSLQCRSVNFSSESAKSWFRGRIKGLKYNVVSLGDVGMSRQVPDYIRKPDYAVSGVANEPESDNIQMYNKEEIQHMKQSCSLAKVLLDAVSSHVKVGVTTDELDAIAHSTCIGYNAYPSPLNYRGFPKSICTSVNNIACHGIPDNRSLQDGDIISIDVSVFYNGYHGDCAATYMVGKVDPKGIKLMSTAVTCLEEAVKICRPGQNLCQIGKTISEVAHQEGYSVVPAFCGHGIGTYFHGPPNILHYENDEGGVMLEGMIFTIEPVISEGGPDIVVLEDGWTAASEDNSRSAQFEHTVLINQNGAEILTVADAFNPVIQ